MRASRNQPLFYECRYFDGVPAIKHFQNKSSPNSSLRFGNRVRDRKLPRRLMISISFSSVGDPHAPVRYAASAGRRNRGARLANSRMSGNRRTRFRSNESALTSNGARRFRRQILQFGRNRVNRVTGKSFDNPFRTGVGRRQKLFGLSRFLAAVALRVERVHLHQ